MHRFWSLALFVTTTFRTVYGTTTVNVDCQFNVEDKRVRFTVTGTLDGGVTPTSISIDECSHSVALDTAGQATIDFTTQCTNVNWIWGEISVYLFHNKDQRRMYASGPYYGKDIQGKHFLLTVQQVPDIFQTGDEKWDALCAHDTSTLRPSMFVSASSVASAGFTVDYISPTASVFITTDSACMNAAESYVTVGTQLYLCIFLDEEFITDDGFDGKIIAVKAYSASGKYASQGFELTKAGCRANNVRFWRNVQPISQGKLKVPFTAFMFSDITTSIDAQRFEVFFNVCKHEPNVRFCGGYKCEGVTIYRRKREALNVTKTIRQLKVATSISVSADPLIVLHENRRQDSLHATGTDVCLQRAGFYGIVIFLILALLTAISASFFLFVKARKSRNYVDERHLYESGSHNPSFRA